MLLASSSSQDILASILDLAQNLIAADAYAVWRTPDARIWRMVASRGLPPDYRSEVTSPPDYLPRFEAIPDVNSNDTVGKFGDLYAAYGIRSLLVVPLQLHNSIPTGPNGGTITFYWKTHRKFTDLDIAYASALANLSSAAINVAELNQQNQRERARLSFLADASEILASSLDYEITLERVAQLAVPQIADWCIVHVLENNIPTRLVVTHADPNQLALAKDYSKRYPEKIVPDRGLGYVLRTGKPEFHPSISDEMVVAVAKDEEHLRILRTLRLSGSILVPLRSHSGTPLGAIRLLAANGRSFGQDDLRLAEDLSRRASGAIENARLHREVIDQENRLRLAHAAARMGTWSWDLLRNEIAWSDEWKHLHGLPPDIAPDPEIGQSLIHPEEREQVLTQLSAALASTSDLAVFEHRVLTPDKRLLWVHHRARIVRDHDGHATSIIGISMDVTERRQAEETLRRTEKLAAAGRLAATVAHEINNPLESIVNLIYIAKLSPGLPAETVELLTSAENELDRTAQIVRQTLGFYRESVHPQQSDIGRIVSDIVELYRSRIQARSLTCHTHIQHEVLASVIPGELRQVVANLLSNAIDATSSGGTLKVSVELRDSAVVIAVSDSGCGIDDAYLPRLFEPFFTTKADIGTGLGLWVSKGIVEKHGGTIGVHTSTAPVGHGTTFTITLPLNTSQHHRGDDNAAAARHFKTVAPVSSATLRSA